ncbi:MAG: ThiF family adenylyltransferase [Acidobacteriota bacterium]|jgi:molybdopterin-synthase adenylyltransferase
MSSTRYSRQERLPWLGQSGQGRIERSSVGIVGLGALGGTAAELLARAGVSRIVAVDRDIVDLSNLHRQILYTEDDVRNRLPKAHAAAARLRSIRSDLDVQAWNLDLGPEQALRLFREVDLVLDGTDNYETRYLLNDAAVHEDKPWIHSGVVGMAGSVLTVVPGESPCLRCLFPESPPPGTAPTCDTAGVLGPAASFVASLQAAEALKILSRHTELLMEGMARIDLLDFSVRLTSLPRDPQCPCCGRRSFDYLEERKGSRTHSLCGRDAVMLVPERETRLDLAKAEQTLAAMSPVYRNSFILQTEWEGHAVTLFTDGRAMIHGTQDVAFARTLYARYLGM